MFKNIIKKVFGLDTKVEAKKAISRRETMRECDELLDGLFGEDGASFTAIQEEIDSIVITVGILGDEQKKIAEALGYSGVLTVEQLKTINEVFDAITVDEIVIPDEEVKVSELKPNAIVETANGRIDVTQEKKWLQPVIQVNDDNSITRRDARITDKWAEIARRLNYVGHDAVVIENSKYGTASDVLVENNSGIYRLKNGKKIKLNTLSNRRDSHLTNIHIDSTYAGGLRVRPYQLRALLLAPHLYDRFMNDNSLDVNHCIIRSDRNPGEVESIRYYEIVDKGSNCRHGHFVRKYSLYDAPVSVYDIGRLKTIFKYFDVDYTEYEQEQDETADIEVVLGDPNTYPVLFRRFVAWVYYLQMHTEQESYDLYLFQQFMNKTFDVNLTIMELKRNYVDPVQFDYIK